MNHSSQLLNQFCQWVDTESMLGGVGTIRQAPPSDVGFTLASYVLTGSRTSGLLLGLSSSDASSLFFKFKRAYWRHLKTIKDHLGQDGLLVALLHPYPRLLSCSTAGTPIPISELILALLKIWIMRRATRKMEFGCSTTHQRIATHRPVDDPQPSCPLYAPVEAERVNVLLPP